MDPGLFVILELHTNVVGGLFPELEMDRLLVIQIPFPFSIDGVIAPFFLIELIVPVSVGIGVPLVRSLLDGDLHVGNVRSVALLLGVPLERGLVASPFLLEMEVHLFGIPLVDVPVLGL